MGNFMGDIQLSVSGYLEGLGIGGSIATVIIAVVLLAFAFFSYKLLNIGLFLVGAVGGATLGSNVLAPIVAKFFEEPPSYLTLVVAGVGALLGVILVLSLKNLAIFICGAFLGYSIGAAINAGVAAMLEAEFLLTLPGNLIVPLVSALLCGLICKFLFKYVYIIGTGAGASVAAVSMIFSAFIPSAQYLALWIGLAIGVVAIIVQFKMNGKSKK